tara:strand:+ start:156 stop:269 length:114 start_codon:yes stop_codon:yes gene_type:complete
MAALVLGKMEFLRARRKSVKITSGNVIRPGLMNWSPN